MKIVSFTVYNLNSDVKMNHRDNDHLSAVSISFYLIHVLVNLDNAFTIVHTSSYTY